MQPPNLKELAAEGHQRRAEHDAAPEERARGDRELLIALGGHYGTEKQRRVGTLLKLALVLFAASMALLVVMPGEVPRVLGLVSFIATMVLLPLRFSMTPTASAAQREAEEVWLRNLPFTVVGYFEALRAEPRKECRLRVALEHAGEPRPATELWSGLVHRIDPGATPGSDGPAWLSSAISGATNVRQNRQLICRNHRLVEHMHVLVEQVLLPLHREYPLRQVTVQRED
jgi:hypothetical protein